MMQFRRLRTGSLALTGVAGMVLAHVVSYRAVFPNGHERAMHMHETGHGYWAVAVTAALAAAIATLASALWRGVNSGSRQRNNAEDAPAWIRFAGLATWQVVLFAGIESLERLSSGVSPETLLRRPEFVVGLGLQVVVAAVALWLTRSVSRLASLVASALRRRPKRRSASIRRAPGSPPLPGMVGWPLSRPRAPPVTLVP